MFLSQTDLATLTGVRRPSAQVRWLLARGWRFEVDQAGRPVVLVAEAERRMLSGPVKREPRVNISAL